MMKRMSALLLAVLFAWGSLGVVLPERVAEAAPPNNSLSFEVVFTEDLITGKSYTAEVIANQAIENLTDFKLYVNYEDAADSFTISAAPALTSIIANEGRARYVRDAANSIVGVEFTVRNTGNDKNILPRINKGDTIFTFKINVTKGSPSATDLALVSYGAGVFRDTVDDVDNPYNYVDVEFEENTSYIDIIGSYEPNVKLQVSGDFPSIGSTIKVEHPGGIKAGATVQYAYLRMKEGATKYPTPTNSDWTDSNEYTVQTADLGQYVVVAVRATEAAGVTGNIVYCKAPLDDQPELITKKQAPAAPGPNSIIITQVGDDYIQFQKDPLYEWIVEPIDPAIYDETKPYAPDPDDPYGLPDGAWTNGANTIKAKAATSYMVWARYRETADTLPSAPYRFDGTFENNKRGLVRTSSSTYNINIQIKCDDGSTNPGFAYYSVHGNATLGSTVYLYAVPDGDNGYYFDKFTSATPGLANTDIISADQVEGAYFQIANLDEKTPINIIANFGKKKETSIYVRETSMLYNQKISNWYQHLDIRLLNDAENLNVSDVIKLYYREANDDGPGKELTPNIELDTGIYTIVAVFGGSTKNLPSTNDTVKFTVHQAVGSTPQVHEIEERDINGEMWFGIDVSENSVTIKNTKTGQKYLVYPKNIYDPTVKPSTDLDMWQWGTGGEITFSGLYAGQEYEVHTYIPGNKNLTDSAIVSTLVSTYHTWKVSILDGQKTCPSIAFFGKVVGSNVEVPEARTVTIRNDGNGKLANITVEFADDAQKNYFELGGTYYKPATQSILIDSLEPGKSVTFTIKPNSSLADSNVPYSAQLIIHAQQDETHEQKRDTDGENGKTVIQGLPGEIKLAYTISDSNPIIISGLKDKTTVYNGSPQGIDTTDVKVTKPADFDGRLIYTYEGYNGTTHDDPTQVPTDAGTYLVLVTPTGDYAGLEQAILTIEKAELTITGLEVIDKIYDGTVDVMLTGGNLEGIKIGADNNPDNVYIDGNIPNVGTFNSENHGSKKKVTLGQSGEKLELAGSKAHNYVLKQPELYGSIQKRPITPIIDTITKTYDGLYTVAPSLISSHFNEKEIIKNDPVPRVRFENVTTAQKDVGNNIAVNWALATLVEENNIYGNYLISIPQDEGALATANIIPKRVTVEISGESVVDYDGRPKTLQATYEACEGDVPVVNVTYNDTTSAPIMAGRYIIGAQIADSNYELGGLNGVRELTIRAAKLYKTDVTRTMIPGDQTTRSIPVSAFHVTTATGYTNVAGTFSINSVVDDNSILADGFPKLENGEIFFRVNPTAQLDQFAEIQLIFTPSEGTYEPLECYLLLLMAKEGYTNSIINPPTTVNLGDQIDVSKTMLRTVFDSDNHTEDVPVTANMLSGDYDPKNISTSNLGMKTITVSLPGTLRSASFNINVVDVVDGFTVQPPDKLTYKYMTDKVLDLTGGYIMPVMRSGAAADTIALTLGMLNITNSKLLEIGTHSVNVTHSGITKPRAFEIDVVESSTGITEPPPGGGPGVIDPGDDNEFTDEDGNKIEPVNIQLVIQPLGNSYYNRVMAAMAADDFFKDLTENNYQMLDIFLKEKETGKIVTAEKPLKLRLGYPSSVTQQNVIRVLHVPGSADAEVLFPKLTEDGIEVDASGFSPFVIGWLPLGSVDPGGDPSPDPGGTSPSPGTSTSPSPGGSGGGWYGGGGGGGTSSGSGTSSSGTSESAKKFWAAVLESIKGAPDNSVIRVNARSYDQMPVEVMDAMTKTKGMTLVISWDGGNDIVITSKTAFTPESTREYFPLSLLQDLFGTEPPKTDDPEEGEEWLQQQREERANASSSTRTGSTSGVPSADNSAGFRDAVNAYITNAVENSGGNVYDITAPVDEEAALQGVTSSTEGWLAAFRENGGAREAVTRPELEAPTLSTPGLGTLLIILGGVFAIAGAAVAMYILRNRRAEEEDE